MEKETRRILKEERQRKKERKRNKKARMEKECIAEKMNCFRLVFFIRLSLFKNSRASQSEQGQDEKK